MWRRNDRGCWERNPAEKMCMPIVEAMTGELSAGEDSPSLGAKRALPCARRVCWAD